MRRSTLLLLAVLVSLTLVDFSDALETVVLTPPVIKPMSQMKQIACYRPVRKVIPRISVKNISTDRFVAFNYGHGGSGWTLAPGSAKYVVDRLLKHLGIGKSMTKDEPVTIVGGGIIGLMTAYTLLDKQFTNITIVAESFENLTSHTAGGLWGPSFQRNDKTKAQIKQYRQVLKDSHVFYKSVIKNPKHPFHKAVAYVPLYACPHMPFVKEVKDHYKKPDEVTVSFGGSVNYKMLRYNDAIFMHVLRFMKSLKAHLDAHKGVTFQERKLSSLKEVQSRIVINCAGIGAGVLVQMNDVQPFLGNMIHVNNNKSEAIDYMILARSPQQKLILYFPKLTDIDGNSMGILGGSYLRVADTMEKHEEQYSRIVRDAQWFFYGVSKPNVSEGPADGYRDRENDEWRQLALDTLWEVRYNMSRTPIYRVDVPGHPQLELYFKDETKSLTGNLKNRFAWGLYHWAIIEGHIGPLTRVYEGSSGSMAASEAFIASKLNITFVAVIPEWTEQEKRDKITGNGGELYVAQDMKEMLFGGGLKKMVAEKGGFYMNQFANAEKAEEFHESEAAHLASPPVRRRTGTLKKVSYESTNLMHEIVAQLQEKLNAKEYVYPDYFIHSAGTGTSKL
ncbi:Pyridoxal-phosphate dependent enzyme family protein [Aphelenchoides avenae]|nr:Pyridoxal-phosphate dependent enzyme family protein [Aphelenchus avenae]